jgi:hypothetical protein
MNDFLKAATTKTALTANGAVSNSTSGNEVLDYFAKCGTYRNRKLKEVDADMSRIFSEDLVLALKTVFYNRMITRRVNGFGGFKTEKVQKGQGNRDEFIKSLKWLEENNPDLLYSRLFVVPIVGSWKDLWYDSPSSNFFHYVNPSKVYELVQKCLVDENQCSLIAKFLPKIRSKRNIKNKRHIRMNAWAKDLCKFLGWSERDYRKFKSNPQNNAHLFQRQMCNKEWEDIDFKKIPGKALFNMISRKGRDKVNVIDRHNLTNKYETWIKSQPVAKFTGYVYELIIAAKGRSSVAERYTYNKQFDGLIELAKKDGSSMLEGGVLCALDTSGSMGGMGVAFNGKVQPIDVCVSLGIYFSKLLTGSFADNVIMFDNNSKFLQLKGEFCDRVDQVQRSATALGGTNFQSVIDEIVRVRKSRPNIPVEDYPSTLLVVSDMQFNPSGGFGYEMGNPLETETNYETAMRKLKAVGLPEMSIIWWNINGQYGGDVPSTMTDVGTTLISGNDPSIITAILEKDTVVDESTGETRKANPLEKMEAALDQQVLNALVVGI